MLREQHWLAVMYDFDSTGFPSSSPDLRGRYDGSDVTFVWNGAPLGRTTVSDVQADVFVLSL